MTIALVLLAVALLAALGLAAGALVVVRRQRAELEEAHLRVDQLEADLTTALRPRPAATATERAVARVALLLMAVCH